MAISAVVGAVGSVGGALLTSQASKKASSQQAAAAQQAAQVQSDQYGIIREDLAPYREAGQPALDLLSAGLGPGGAFSSQFPQYSPYREYTDFDPTMERLRQTPGYQFTLGEGQRAVTNSMAAQGLAGSGAHMRGIADYTTGLASTTYQNELANYMNQYRTGLDAHQAQYQTGFNAFQSGQTNLYNRLMGLAQLGQGAAAQTGSAGQTAAQGISNALIGAGNAQASGTMGAANAWAGGLSGVAGSLSQFAMLNSLQQFMRPPTAGAR